MGAANEGAEAAAAADIPDDNMRNLAGSDEQGGQGQGQGQGQGEGEGDASTGYATKWTCDICKIKAFDTLEAAAEHEETCTGPPPTGSAVAVMGAAGDGGGVGQAEAIDLTLDDSDDDDDNVEVVDAAPHPRPAAAVVLSSQQSNSRLPAPAPPPPPPPPRHPSTPPHRFSIVPPRPQQQVLPASVPPTANGGINGGMANDSSNPTETGEAMVTVWTCDKCRVHEFTTFEEAAEHEMICEGITSNNDQRAEQQQLLQSQSAVTGPAATAAEGQGTTAAAVAAAAPTRMETTAELAASLPAAVVTGTEAIVMDHPNDIKYWTCDVCNVAQFPTYELAAEHERTCEGNPHAPVKSITTTNRMGPDGTGGHLRPGEEEEEEFSQITEPLIEEMNFWACDSCGVARFRSFEEASAHENVCRRTREQFGKSILSADDRPAAAGRGEDLPPTVDDSSPERKNSTQETRYVPASLRHQQQSMGDTETIPAGTVFPLMHVQFAQDELLNLPPRVIVALDQMLLVPVHHVGRSDAAAPSLSSSVELFLCCKHCDKSWRLDSLKKLHAHVDSAIRNHLYARSYGCASIPADVCDLLQKLKRAPPKRSGPKTSIEEYCHYVIDKYGLVDVPGAASGASVGIDPSSVVGALVIADLAIEPAVIAKMKALEAEFLTAESAPIQKSRARDTSSDESVDAAKETKKKKRKRGRPSSQVEKVEEDIDEDEERAMLDQDQYGNEYHMLPAGGVPLVSSQSVVMYFQLSRYYQLVIDNLELYEVGGKTKARVLRLRCQNCKANPHLTTYRKLSNVASWYKAVKQMASSHVVSCPCLSPLIRQEVEMAQKVNKDKALVAYCDYLSSLYNMRDSKHGVVWGECMPIQSAYIGFPGSPSENGDTIPNPVPRHILMLPPAPPTAPKRDILSDYYYLQAAQFKFVLVERRTPNANKNRSRLSSPSHPDLVIALGCQNCNYVKGVESIRDFSSSSTYLLNSHLRTCRPEECTRRLDVLKDIRHRQEKKGAITVSKYAKHLMVNVYGMVDLKWNGVSGGVGFSSNTVKILSRLGAKYGRSQHLRVKNDKANTAAMNGTGTSWESFALPLLLEDVVEPFTAGLSTDLNENRVKSQDGVSSAMVESTARIEGNKENSTAFTGTSEIHVRST